MLCEQLGQEPDPDKMPLDASMFPYEVQVAFFVFDLLSDRWDGMSGTYLGKDWTACDFIFETFEIDKDDKREIVYIGKIYESILMKHRAEEAEAKRKQAERTAKAKSGSNTFSVSR